MEYTAWSRRSYARRSTYTIYLIWLILQLRGSGKATHVRNSSRMEYL